MECYVPLAEPRNEPPLPTAVVESATQSEQEYHYRKVCSVCKNIFFDKKIPKDVYEVMVDNGGLKYSREFSIWYLTIESVCSTCP